MPVFVFLLQPIGQDSNLVRRLPDDVYQTPKRKRGAAAAAKPAKIGHIQVRENAAAKNPKIPTPELAKLPKLKKVGDEILSTTYKVENSTTKESNSTNNGADSTSTVIWPFLVNPVVFKSFNLEIELKKKSC